MNELQSVNNVYFHSSRKVSVAHRKFTSGFLLAALKVDVILFKE